MDSIAVIGEAVADAFATAGNDTLRLDVRPGGSPANTAVALSRLGTPTRFLGRLSTGILGRLLRDHLAQSHVDLAGAIDTETEATLAIAALDAEGSASYDFYANDTADWQWRAGELDPGDAAAIHTGSLALIRPPGDAVITETLRAHRQHKTICIDPNVRPSIADATTYRERMDTWSSLSDIVKLSEDDLSTMYPNSDRRALFDHWHTQGASLIIVTLGPQGAVASLDGTELHIPGITVDVADTIGAGDAFTAGLLHHLRAKGALGGRLQLTPDDVGAAVSFAVQIAARTCETPGANPPWGRQL